MTEGIFADIKMIKFGATTDEIYKFLNENIAELDKTAEKMPKSVEKAKKDIDEYLEDTANEEVRKLINHTYEGAKAWVEDNINLAKQLINEIAMWYSGDIESAELWVFIKSNEISTLIANAEMELEFLENIVDNVKKMMDEAKAKSEELGVEYNEGSICVEGCAVRVQKPYPEIEDKYDL